MCYLAVFGTHHVDGGALEKLVRAMNIVKARRFYDYFYDTRNLDAWVRDRWRALYEDGFVEHNLWAPAHASARVILGECKNWAIRRRESWSEFWKESWRGRR